MPHALTWKVVVSMSSGLKTAALLGGMSGLFILMGGALGGEAGMAIAFAMAIVMNVGSYWFSDRLVLRMYRATEVGSDHRSTASRRVWPRGRFADAARLRHSRDVAERVRDRARPGPRGRRRDRGHPSSSVRRTSWKASSPTSCRTSAPRHSHQQRRGHDRGGDPDDRQHGAIRGVLRRRVEPERPRRRAVRSCCWRWRFWRRLRRC